MSAERMQRLSYCEYHAAVDIQFWEALRTLKLTKWRVDEPLVFIRGHLTANLSERVFPNALSAVCLDRESFGVDLADEILPSRSDFVRLAIPGTLRNYNTMPNFDSACKGRPLHLSLLTHLIGPLFLSDTPTGVAEDPVWSEMSYGFFTMLTFTDAKRYQFYHREAFPAVLLNSPLYSSSPSPGHGAHVPFSRTTAEQIHSYGADLIRQYPSRGCNPFLCTWGTQETCFAGFSPRQYTEWTDAGKSVVVCFTDTSSAPMSLCWAARNVLTCLRLALPSLVSLTVYALRGGSPDQSLYMSCTCEALDALAVRSTFTELRQMERDGELLEARVEKLHACGFLKASGWRKASAGPIDLSSLLDPSLRADSDSRMNLELMRWRMLPTLQLEALGQCKALLLGTGTLGCCVAQNLLMWGVRHISLVDRSAVSYSNLARQTLFSMEDARERRSKVDAAAAALRAIIPTVHVRPVPMTIHMPGHRIDSDRAAEALREIQDLAQLIQEHDVVFLLTDSREARWLPTVVAAAHGVPVLNVALGFDTYVVMRHGIVSDTSSSNAVGESTDATSSPHGCYFCSDVVAPSDSLTGRTLDQQCTVTRPGVSSIAAAIAVEFLAQIYQHPLGFRAPSPKGEPAGGERKGLGSVPQQTRGSVFSHTMTHFCGERSPCCTACSEGILSEYLASGSEFLLRCVNDPLYIEAMCGVKELKEQWENQPGSIEWDSDCESST